MVHMSKDLRKRNLLIIAGLMGIIGSLILWYLLRPQPIMRIGEWSIYPQDVEYRQQIANIHFPQAKEGVGLMQLKKSAIHLKILQNHGLTFTNEEVIREAKRIETNTKGPDILKKIKKVFKGDHASYLKNYVKPILVDRSISYDFFENHPQIHKQSLKKAQELIEWGLKKPEKVKAKIKELGLKTNETLVSLEGLIEVSREENKNKQKLSNLNKLSGKKGFLFSRIKENNNLIKKRQALKWFELVKELEPMEMVKKPINRRGSWVVLQKLESLPAQTHKVLVISVPKISYHNWLTEESAKVTIETD